MSYKSINGLMRHLRDNHISISGSSEKLQLRNNGYYHGYKGYRFFQTSDKKIPFTSYKEINATVEYDNQLKSLFYPEVMFIETAVKNVALNVVMNDAGSEEIPVIFDKMIASYNNFRKHPLKESVKNIRKLSSNCKNKLTKRLHAHTTVMTQKLHIFITSLAIIQFHYGLCLKL